MLTGHLYHQWRLIASGSPRTILAETAEPYSHLPITERLVQAIWYDQRVRADALHTTDGHAVKVLAAGFWNLEAGPDFRRALIQFGDDKPVLTDVEIHLSAADWERHNHQRDPLYNNVGLHVVLWDAGSDIVVKTADNRTIPQLALETFLTAPLAELCDAIDPEAYPYSDSLHTGLCAPALRKVTAETRDALLNAAGDERLTQKAQKFARWAATSSFDQALYEGIMEALGYKANKLPFRLLAQRLPLANLPPYPLAREAALLGLAGFLPKKSARLWDTASRKRVKVLWNCWWKMQSDLGELTLDSAQWKLAGLRPQNFPQRRLAAMNALMSAHQHLADDVYAIVVVSSDPKQTLAALENIFVALEDDFWSSHYNFGGRSREPIALIGRARARDIVVNVLIPFALAQARAHDDASAAQRAIALYAAAPRLASHSVEIFAAYRFFGPKSPTKKILFSARRQQGLLQLFRDFCLNDTSACAHCPLPDLIAQWPRAG